MEKKEIDQKVEAYRSSLINKPERPKPTIEQRLNAIGERLNKVQMALGKHDARRMRLLVQECKLHTDLGDLPRVYSTAIEIAQLARTNVLGIGEAHPVLPSERPPTFTPMLPPSHEETVQ